MSSQPNILEVAEPMQLDDVAAQAAQARDPEADASWLRSGLYEYFPTQREQIDEAFREYYAFRSDGSDSASGQSTGKAAGANTGFSQ